MRIIYFVWCCLIMSIISYVLEDICCVFISSTQSDVRHRSGFGSVLSCIIFLAELMGKTVCDQRRVFVLHLLTKHEKLRLLHFHSYVSISWKTNKPTCGFFDLNTEF